jgi:hypothetical protein
MINNPEWKIPEINPYIHQISLVCIKYLVDCLEQLKKDEIDGSTCFGIQKQILIDEIEDHAFLEFAIENFGEMVGYIVDGNLNIRILKGITGEIWFGVSKI